MPRKKKVPPRIFGRVTDQFSEEVKAIVIRTLGAGCYRSTAAEAAGVSRKTLEGWIAAGEAGREPYAAWVRELRAVEATIEEISLRTINASGDWRAVAWFLERRWPRRWGSEPFRLKLQEQNALPDFKTLSPAERLRELEHAQKTITAALEDARVEVN